MIRRGSKQGSLHTPALSHRPPHPCGLREGGWVSVGCLIGQLASTSICLHISSLALVPVRPREYPEKVRDAVK